MDQTHSSLFCIGLCAFLASGCSDTNSTDNRGQGNLGQGDQGGQSDQSDQDGFGNPSGSGGDFGNGPTGSGDPSGDGTGSMGTTLIDGCGGDAYMAEGGPLDMILLYDDSLSMTVITFAWEPLKMAMTDFLNAPQSEGIGVGLTWFSTGCSPNATDNANVPIALLPGNAQAVIAEINAHGAMGNATQTKHAIDGASSQAQVWQTANPATKTIIVLVTDGQPGAGTSDGCPTDSTIPNTVQAAMDAAAAGIPVYVIGAGPALNELNQIAAGGGTGMAYIADPAAGSQPIVDALNSIRSSALPCNYSIPLGGETTPETVNLYHNGAAIPRVDSADLCPGTGGWYYEDMAGEKRLTACEASCEALHSGGEVQVILGCPVVLVE